MVARGAYYKVEGGGGGATQEINLLNYSSEQPKTIRGNGSGQPSISVEAVAQVFCDTVRRCLCAVQYLLHLHGNLQRQGIVHVYMCVHMCLHNPCRKLCNHQTDCPCV